MFSIKDSGGIVALGTYTLFGVVTAVVYAMAGPRRKVYWRTRGDYGLVTVAPRRRRRRQEDYAEDDD